MKIIEVNIPQSKVEHTGLAPISMKKLGKIVVLAGKNGAGKTRLIQTVKNAFSAMPEKRNESRFIETVTKRSASEEEKKNQLAILTYLKLDGDKTNNWILLDFVPKKTVLMPSNTASKKDIERAHKNAQIVDPRKMDEDMPELRPLHYMTRLQNMYHDATHQHSVVSDEKKKYLENEYERLQYLLRNVLNTELSRSEDGDIQLFDRKEDALGLSEGQEVLLHFCIQLHAKGNNLSDCILFLDEPENHLHPSVLLEVIDKISEVVPDGQLWIATHSVNLISHLQDASLFYIENGKIEPVRNCSTKLLEGLLGDEPKREMLADFIALPQRFAEVKFSYECLLDASVVMTDVDDPQTQQVREILAEGGKPIKVVDFGAGKGRLIQNIAAYELQENREFKNGFDYRAFDPLNTYADMCKENIALAYGDSVNRYFNSVSDLEEALEENSVDFVILLNVFHEIDPATWLEMFQKDGVVTRLLKPNGVLLIVEHQMLNIGEKAHSKGFIMFDEGEFQTFFSVTDEEKAQGRYSVITSKGRPELKAHSIQRDLLERVSCQTQMDAIRKLNKRALQEIRNMKKESNEEGQQLKNGRRLAFWSQQFANSALALET